MKKTRRWMKTAGIIIMTIAMSISALPVYAAPDWTQIPETEAGAAQGNVQKMQCAFDENNLYLRITGSESNKWDELPSLQVAVNQKPLEGVLAKLTLVAKDIPEEGQAVVSVKDGNWQERVTGTLTRSNRVNTIEITISLLTLGYKGEDVSEITVSALVGGNKAVECSGVFIGQNKEEPQDPKDPEQPIDPEKPVDPEQPVKPEEDVKPEQKDVTIDGDFSDWDGYELTYVNADGINMVSMVSDGKNLYVRILEDASYDFSFPWRETTLGITSNMGKILWLKAKVDGKDENATMTFLGIEGAVGRCGRVEGAFNWEISIPLNEIWQGITYISNISMISHRNTTKPIMTVSNPSYVDRGENGGELDVSTGMVMDGYYQDWDSIPHMEITYGADDKANNHIGALYMGENAMYVHYKLNRLFDSHIRVDYMEIKINGKLYKLWVLPVDKNGNIDWNRQNQIQSLGKGIYTDYGVFISDVPNAPTYYNNLNGQAAITIYETPRTRESLGDEVEFSLSYDRIEELTGMKRSEIRKVELYNPHIGNQWLTCVGTSSGPLLGVGISIVAAIALYYVWDKKRRKKEEKA